MFDKAREPAFLLLTTIRSALIPSTICARIVGVELWSR